MTKELDPNLIYFGQTFYIDDDETRPLQIVLDTRREDSIETASVLEKNGREVVSIPGGIPKNRAGNPLGIWDLDRIKKAFENDGRLSSETEKILEERATYPPTTRINTSKTLGQ